MNKELRAFLRTQAVVAGAFNFFVNGMVTGMIYHKADLVSTGAVSIAIDIFITCLCIFIITEPFSRASLERTKTWDILDCSHPVIRFFSRIFRLPVISGALLGLFAAVVLSVLVVPIFSFRGFKAIRFGWYMAYKTTYCALVGAGASAAMLYLGMCRSNEILSNSER